MPPFQLAFDHQVDYLHVRILGRAPDISSVYDGFGDIALTCHEGRKNRLLIECDEAAAKDNHGLVRALDEFMRLSRGMKIAVANCHASIDSKLRDTITELAVSGAEVGYFTDQKEAEAWLISGAPPKWPAGN